MRVLSPFNRRKVIFSTSGPGTTGLVYAEENVGPQSSTHTKTNSKRLKDLTQSKKYKLLEENTGIKRYGPESWICACGFLYMCYNLGVGCSQKGHGALPSSGGTLEGGP